MHTQTDITSECVIATFVGQIKLIDTRRVELAGIPMLLSCEAAHLGLLNGALVSIHARWLSVDAQWTAQSVQVIRHPKSVATEATAIKSTDTTVAAAASSPAMTRANVAPHSPATTAPSAATASAAPVVKAYTPAPAPAGQRRTGGFSFSNPPAPKPKPKPAPRDLSVPPRPAVPAQQAKPAAPVQGSLLAPTVAPAPSTPAAAAARRGGFRVSTVAAPPEYATGPETEAPAPRGTLATQDRAKVLDAWRLSESVDFDDIPF